MRTWRLFSVFAVLALVLAACGDGGASPSEAAGESEPATASEGAEPSAGASDEPSDGEPQSGGTLVYGAAAEIASLDPSQTSDGESFRVLQQVYEPLVDLVQMHEFPRDVRDGQRIEHLQILRQQGAVQRTIDELSLEERTILKLRYGILQDEELTLRDIGEILGLSRERVRQIESRAEAKCRRSVRRA